MGKLSRRLGKQLTLYVRHLAWLHATPKPHEGSKRAAEAGRKDVSRLDALKAQKVTPPMPPNPIPHIIERWIEIGMTQAGGMAPAPLSWGEINDWQAGTGVTLGTWEYRLIRALSVAYVTESRRAEDETCPPPWNSGVTARERQTEEARLRAVLG